MAEFGEPRILDYTEDCFMNLICW